MPPSLWFGLLFAGASLSAPDAGLASADAQLAVAQSALCGAPQQSALAAEHEGDTQASAAVEALRLQRAAQGWVDAWDMAGRPRQALDAVLICRADAVTPLYVDALTQMTQGHFDAAQSRLAAAWGLAPKAWCAGLGLSQGVCALHRHKPQEALAHLQSAQRADPRRVAIRVATAKAYLALSRPSDTICSLKPILTEATEPPSSREIEQARNLVGMAIEQDAGHISNLERTALQNLLAMAQDSETGAPSVEMALSLAEAVPRPRVQTAAALVALKAQMADAGRKLLKEAFTHASLDPDPARLLALYNVEHGGAEAALPCLALAAERDPFNTETQTLIAELQERTGDFSAAQKSIAALMRLEPEQTRHPKSMRRVQAQAQATRPEAKHAATRR